MKKTFLFIAIFLSLGITAYAENNILENDKQGIANNLSIFVEAVNKGDAQQISTTISPDNPGLIEIIQNHIRGGGINYQFYYEPYEKNIEVLDEETVKIKGKFAASGIGWTMTGLSNYFILEKNSNNQWLIKETDFNEKVSFDNMMRLTKKIFLVATPIFMVVFVFWLWMLVDCIKRNFEDKNLWIVLLLFFSLVAAILYYFLIKKKNITKKPLEFRM